MTAIQRPWRRELPDYLLDNASSHANDRFRLLERLYDPITIAQLKSITFPTDARCWDIGTGSGSIARYLSKRLGGGGAFICATDIDCRWVNVPDQVTVIQHDVTRDAFTDQPWDMIHARCVVEHLEDPSGTIDRLVATLRPGGWLFLEELDPILPYCLDPQSPDDRLVNRVGAAFTALLARHSFPALGRQLHREMMAAGLTKVTNHGHLFPSTGAGTSAELMKVNIQQFWSQIEQIDDTLDLRRYCELLDDPETDIALPVFFAAMGQRPR